MSEYKEKYFHLKADFELYKSSTRKCDEVFTQQAGVICRKTFEKAILEQQLKETQEKLKNYENGFKGACATCENVGELNIKLEQQLKEANKVINYYLPILEERLSCGAYARQYLTKYKTNE